MTTLTKRRDFLAANGGRRAPMPGFVLLVHDRRDADPAMRIGYTVTKKIGNAVVRNRMKRRLRSLARELLPTLGHAGADHVLIGRQGGIERDYALLRTELTKALRKVGSQPVAAPWSPRPPKASSGRKPTPASKPSPDPQSPPDPKSSADPQSSC